MGKTIAFIPVRGGSKSISLKNIKVFNSKPLVYWVLLAANNSNLIDEVIVSTDSDAIRNVVESFNFNKTVIVNRKVRLAEDTSSTESVMLDYARNHDFENIILLQATSPLTTSNHIDEAVNLYLDSLADSLLSVVRTHRFIWKMEENLFLPINYDYKNRPRRQDWDGQLIENGAIYITKKDMLIKSQSRISGNILPFIMPEYTYYEIDEPSDWVILENIHKRINSTQLSESLKLSLSKIQMVITDVDGVLTNGNMIYIGENLEGKEFNTRDGMGVEILRRKNINCAIITGESHISVSRRAIKLQIDEVYTGIQNKLDIVHYIKDKCNLSLDQIAYIGDDLNDLEAMNVVGLSVAVADAVREVQDIATLILSSKGGTGAFREFVDILIAAKES